MKNKDKQYGSTFDYIETNTEVFDIIVSAHNQFNELKEFLLLVDIITSGEIEGIIKRFNKHKLRSFLAAIESVETMLKDSNHSYYPDIKRILKDNSEIQEHKHGYHCNGCYKNFSCIKKIIKNKLEKKESFLRRFIRKIIKT